MLRSNPHLIEINARLWLKTLRKKYSLAEMTLSSIPEEEWLELKHLGFDIVWMMGVWNPSPEAAAIARADVRLQAEIKKISPELGVDAIGSSPYAIQGYRLNPELGSEWELKALKEKLNSLGMKLLLDFVSNHTARDNPFLHKCPECFITGSEEDFKAHPDWFFETDIDGKKTYVAYGRDPNFPAWTDSAQFNYFNPQTREKRLELLLELGEVCDGVRCDMVMLTLNDIHESTWGWLLNKKGFKKPHEEFWKHAIRTVQEKHPQFIFLAEVYWGLEWQVQLMGFDYTYDKITYDRLRFMGAEEVRGHLRAEKLYQKRSVRFIDNHDEIPSIEAFGRAKAFAAAVIISTIKGLRFYNDSQLEGLRHKVPLQLKEIWEHVPDMAVCKFYEKLLKIVDHPAFHGGEWNLLDVRQCDPQNHSNKNIMAWSWAQRRTIKIVVVNYSNTPSCGTVNISVKSTGESTALFEELSDRFFTFEAEDLAEGLRLREMAPYAATIFDVEF
ncbi:MAG: alpha-amylase family glycosyl hydrolase [Elusimicrobiota bacterium]